MHNFSNERNYSFNILTYLWDPLPSLNLTDIDPDIVYTVELYQITCGQSILISHETVAEYSISYTVDLMQIYKAVLSPKNNVVNARNGTNAVIRGMNY